MESETVPTIVEPLPFIDHFKDLFDPRLQARVLYPLIEILFLCLIAIIAGANCFTEIELYGKEKLSFLRSFLPFEYGIPSHDQLGNVFAVLDPEEFTRCFLSWVLSIPGLSTDVIAIDGKTSRRSGSKSNGQAAIHMVSAFATQQRLVLAQTKVDEKSNEIVAIPNVLDMVDIKGATVTIDAIGCQRDISQKIINKEGDYVLTLKKNQESLHEDVKIFVDEQKDKKFEDTKISHHRTIEKDHGRIETRDITVIHDIEWLQKRHQWPGLNAIVVIESEREINKKSTKETRFYLTSSKEEAEKISEIIRSHWAIENNLHWVLDISFRDDECRIRTNHAPTNFATMRHAACNLLQRARGKLSMNAGRKKAGWSDGFLAKILRNALP